MPVMSLTPSQVFEKRLATTSDSCVFRGKYTQGFTIAANNSASFLFAPQPRTLGNRPTSAGTLFTRFRLKDLTVKVHSPLRSDGSISGITIGILDDYSNTSDAPTDFPSVQDLRCSIVTSTSESEPDFLFWKPLDPQKWYYVVAPSGEDPRFIYPCAVYASCTGSSGQPVVLEFEYTLVFAGAG